MVLIGRSNCQEQRVRPVSERHIEILLGATGNDIAAQK